MFGLFKSKPKGPVEAPFKVDIHSHLIPAIDDGSQSMEESLEMVRQFSAWGYKKVVTTPHIMMEYYSNTPEIINGGLDKLREAAKAESIEIELEAAAEYYLDEPFEKLLAETELLHFGKEKYVLFELPFFSKPAIYENSVFNMRAKGYIPILAHPERYTYFHDPKLEQFQSLQDQGALLQVNLMSLIGAYGDSVMKMAWKMVDHGLVDFVGSDLHKPRQMEALEKVFRHKKIDKLLELNLRNDSLL